MKFTITTKHVEMTGPDAFETVGLTVDDFDTFEAAYSFGISQMNLGFVSLAIDNKIALYFDINFDALENAA